MFGIYCYDHKRLMGVSEPVKMPKQPNKVSDKMKEIKDQLKKLYPSFLKKNPFCQVKSPVCTKVAVCIHHKKGRGRDEVLDQSTWMSSCEACNGWVEQHDAKAREIGVKEDRIK